jgi:hypothetical protein
VSWEIYNTVSRCFSSFEIKHIWELKEVISNTYSNKRYTFYVCIYITCGNVRPLNLPCLWVRFPTNSLYIFELHRRALICFLAIKKHTGDTTKIISSHLHFSCKTFMQYEMYAPIKYASTRATGKDLDLYSGNSRFKSLPGHLVSWLFRGLPQSLQSNVRVVPRLGQGASFQNLSNSSFTNHRTINALQSATLTAS